MNEYERMKQQRDESIARRLEELVEEVINALIAGKLLHAKCAECKSEGCVITWSTGAKEQIAAIIAKGKISSC